MAQRLPRSVPDLGVAHVDPPLDASDERRAALRQAVGRLPWGLICAIGAGLLIVSVGIGVRVARPSAIAVVDASPTVTCAQAARLLRDPAAESRLVIVHGAFWYPVPNSAGAADTAECDGLDLPVTGKVRDLFDAEGPPRAVAARVSRGALSVSAACVRCPDPRPILERDPRASARALHLAALALGILGAVMVCWGLRRRPGRRGVLDTVAIAPAVAEHVSATQPDVPIVMVRVHDGSRRSLDAEAIVVRDGAPFAGSMGDPSCIERRDRGGYRAAADGAPVLVGPGSVNGLGVAAGARAVLAHGDLVRLSSGPIFSLELPGSVTPQALRYRYDSSGRVRVLATRRAWGMTTAAVLAVTAALAVLHVDELRPRLADPLTIAFAVVALGVLARTPAGGTRWRFGARDLSGESLTPQRPNADGEGGWTWHATDGSARRAVLLERVPPLDVTASREEGRVRSELLREAEIVAGRRAAPADGTTLPDVDDVPRRRPPVRG